MCCGTVSSDCMSSRAQNGATIANSRLIAEPHTGHVCVRRRIAQRHLREQRRHQNEHRDRHRQEQVARAQRPQAMAH